MADYWVYLPVLAKAAQQPKERHSKQRGSMLLTFDDLDVRRCLSSGSLLVDIYECARVQFLQRCFYIPLSLLLDLNVGFS